MDEPNKIQKHFVCQIVHPESRKSRNSLPERVLDYLTLHIVLAMTLSIPVSLAPKKTLSQHVAANNESQSESADVRGCQGAECQACNDKTGKLKGCSVFPTLCLRSFQWALAEGMAVGRPKPSAHFYDSMGSSPEAQGTSPTAMRHRAGLSSQRSVALAQAARQSSVQNHCKSIGREIMTTGRPRPGASWIDCRTKPTENQSRSTWLSISHHSRRCLQGKALLGFAQW